MITKETLVKTSDGSQIGVNGIHHQNLTANCGGLGSMGLNAAYLAMVYEESIRTCADATVIDARGMLCGL